MTIISVRLFLHAPVLRQQCCELLSASGEFQLTEGHAGVGIFDLQDGAATSFLAAARRDSPQMRRLCFSAESSGADCFAAVLLGAQGLLRYDECETQLALAVHHLAAGRIWLPAGVLAAAPFMEQFRGSRRLTRRQCEVVTLAGRGLSISEIAFVLRFSEGAAKFHLRNAYERLGIHSRNDLSKLLGVG